MTGTNNTHITSLDLIRVLAIFFVIAGHFFLVNTHLLQTPVSDVSIFAQGAFTQLFMVAVPLFIVLTGYLNSEKTICRAYFKKIFAVLLSYLVFAILSELVRLLFLKESFSIVSFVKQILGFSIFPYAWYIEMWIGLFLLTPFLNVLYKNLGDKRLKIGLIALLVSITVIPHWINRDGLHLLPGFWAQCWPLAYFFTGSFIKEYQPHIKPCWWFAILGLCLINPTINVFLGTDHYTLFCGGPEDIFSYIISILFFMLIYDLTFDHGKTLLKYLSNITLDVYMGCWIFDVLIYPYFKSNFFETQSQFGLEFSIIIPILVYVSSCALASLVKLAAKPLLKSLN